MSSSDYTMLRRFRETTQGSCNIVNPVPVIISTNSNNYLTINNTNCVLPPCNSNNITSTNQYAHFSDSNPLSDLLTPILLSKLFKNEKYIAKTLNEYNFIPVRNLGVGMIVPPNLLLALGDHVTCYIDTDRQNSFKGVINGYDNVSGFLSIFKLYDIIGNFSDKSIYSIHLILPEPDAFILKDRVDKLYHYFFNSDTIDYSVEDTNHLLIGKQEEYVYQLNMYMLNLNIRQELNYEITDVYLMNRLNDIYRYRYDGSDIIANPDFIPETYIVAQPTTLEDYIVNIFFDLFGVNVLNDTLFNALAVYVPEYIIP
jgi:hypothetical protein